MAKLVKENVVSYPVPRNDQHASDGSAGPDYPKVVAGGIKDIDIKL
jgi:hypothetical protein